MSHRKLLSRHLRHDQRLSLKAPTWVRIFAFWLCPIERSTHTHIHFQVKCNLLLCCVYLPLGLGGVVARRKVPSKEDLGRKKGAHLTFFFCESGSTSIGKSQQYRGVCLAREVLLQHHISLLGGQLGVATCTQLVLSPSTSS